MTCGCSFCNNMRQHAGDKGQRYEIRMTGYPKDGNNVLGWAGTVEGAHKMMAAILTAPGCTSATIYDRQENKNVITRFGGVLR